MPSAPLLLKTRTSIFLITFLFLEVARSFAGTYYVDFSSGSDGNSGVSMSSPWKHCPGDDSAAGNADRRLAPGDTVVFRGGVVYAGTGTVDSRRRVVAVNGSGQPGNEITFISGHLHSPQWGSQRAIIDGGGPGPNAAKTGIMIKNQEWITIEGFEIRNVGIPTGGACAIEFERGGGSPGVGHGVVRNCLIHDVNWSGRYVVGYGIENNGGANHLYEGNIIYRCTDKLIETFGGGNQFGTDLASNAVIRNNILHNSTVHGIVLISDSALVYNNIIWEQHDGVRGGPTGFAIKVDQGRKNKIFNNILYNVGAGLGVLAGYDNEFHHNVVYGVSNNGGGSQQGSDEAGIVFFNDGGRWENPAVARNTFSNNIVYYVVDVGLSNRAKLLYHNRDGGSGNKVLNNLFYATRGDTRNTSSRVRVGGLTRALGDNTLLSVAEWEQQFNALFGGTGNVAKDNLVADPRFAGGVLADLGHAPVGFTKDGLPNDFGFELSTGSPAAVGGVILGAPFDIDIAGVGRTRYCLGAYESTTGSAPPAPPENLRLVR